MPVVGIALVKDEADIIEQTVTRILDQVDSLIIADNDSTDGTRAILDRLAATAELTVLDDADPAHYQSRKTSALAAVAAARGAEWVVPFDADEVWRAVDGRRIADVLSECEGIVAPAVLYNHVATAQDQAGDPVTRMGWRTRDPLGLPKVACRAALPVTIAEGNHAANYPEGVVHGLLEVRHFPYRSPEQFLSKVRNGAAALAATDLSEGVGTHWRQYGELLENAGPEAVEDWFREHFYTTDPAAWSDLVFDPCP